MRYTLLYLAANALTVQLWVCIPKQLHFSLKRWLWDGLRVSCESKVSQDVIGVPVPTVGIHIIAGNPKF